MTAFLVHEVFASVNTVKQKGSVESTVTLVSSVLGSEFTKTVFNVPDDRAFTVTDLTAVNEGGIWKATADGSPAFQGLEFYGPSPKEAMDSAESFVRRLMTEQ